MSSRQKDNQKAESILHHLLRLGSKVTNPIKKRRRKRFWKKQLKELQRQASTSSLATHTTLSHGYSSAFLSLQNSHSCFDEATAAPPNTQYQEDYLDELLSVTSSEYDEKLKTIDQNELLVECFMGNDDSGDTTFVVHFFSEEDSVLSEEIDHFLETQLLENNSSATSKWQCRRVNARLAPLFAKILEIDPEQPTVVAIKDGIMVTKQTELSSTNLLESQLQRWMAATESILSGEQEYMDNFDVGDDNDDDGDDYLVECFMGNDDNSDTAFVVHFFNEDSPVSEEIDTFLEAQLLGNISSSSWEYRRVNAHLAPLFARILEIDPEQPTVVAIKDGIMVTKQTELSSQNVESQLQRWMMATEKILAGEEESVDNFELFDGDCSREEGEEEDIDERAPTGTVVNSSDDDGDSSSEDDSSDSDDEFSSSDDEFSSDEAE